MSHFIDIECPVCGRKLHLYCYRRKTSMRKSCRDHLIKKDNIVRQADIDKILKQMLKPIGDYRDDVEFDSSAPPDWPSEFVIVSEEG